MTLGLVLLDFILFTSFNLSRSFPALIWQCIAWQVLPACAGTSSSSGWFLFGVLCQLFHWKLGREDTLAEARLTMSFLLPTSICLAIAFHSGFLFSHLPLILLLRSPTNPFQILLPVWNLGGNMTSRICFILWLSLFWESIWEKFLGQASPRYWFLSLYALPLFLSPRFSHQYNGTIWKFSASDHLLCVISYARVFVYHLHFILIVTTSLHSRKHPHFKEQKTEVRKVNCQGAFS